MSNWVGRVILLAVIAGVGWVANDYYRAGYHTMPKLPEGAFWLSFKNGLRGIVVDAEDVRPERNYYGYPAEDVPRWFVDTWSTCRPLTDEESAFLEAEADRGPGHRWEAVCEIDADGETVVRGWLASVPNN